MSAIKATKYQVGSNITLTSEGSELIINEGVHNGALTELARIPRDIGASGLSVTRFGAIGDGITDDTVAVQAAVDYAFSDGVSLGWQGTFLTTASISNLHSVRHIGDGAIKRGTDVFHVNPTSNKYNSLYVAANGVATNDGLSPSQPTTITSVSDSILHNYGPIITGNWTINCAAGFYNQYYDRSDFVGYDSQNFIFIKGPDVGGHPNIPTAVFDMKPGSVPSNSTCFQCAGKGLRLAFQDIKIQNTNGTGIAMSLGELQTINVHFTDCRVGLAPGGWVNIGVYGGLFKFTAEDSDEYAHIKEIFHVRHSIGYCIAGTNVISHYPDSVLHTGTSYVISANSVPAKGFDLVITIPSHDFKLGEYISLTIKNSYGVKLVNKVTNITAITTSTITVVSDNTAGTNISDNATSIIARRIVRVIPNAFPDSFVYDGTAYTTDGESLTATFPAHGFVSGDYVNITAKTATGTNFINELFKITGVTTNTITVRSDKTASTNVTDVATSIKCRRIGLTRSVGYYTSSTTHITTTVTSHDFALGDKILAVLGQPINTNVFDEIRTVTAVTSTTITFALNNSGSLSGIAYLYRIKSLDGTVANTIPLFVGTGQGRGMIAQENCTGHVQGLFHRFSQAFSAQASSRGHLEYCVFSRNSRAISFGSGSNVFLNHTVLNDRSSFDNTITLDDVGGVVTNLDSNPVSHRIGTVSNISTDLSITNVINNGIDFCRVYTSVPATVVIGDTVYIDNVLGTTEANGTKTITAVTETYIDINEDFLSTYVSGGQCLFLPKVIKKITTEVIAMKLPSFSGLEFCTNRKIRCIVHGQINGTNGYKDVRLYVNKGIVCSMRLISNAYGSFIAELGFIKLDGDFIMPFGHIAAARLSTTDAISDVTGASIINRSLNTGYILPFDVRVQLESSLDSIQIFMVQIFKE